VKICAIPVAVSFATRSICLMFQGIQKFLDHSRLRIIRNFLIRRNFSCAMSKKVERDASPHAPQLR
jgi:hypothetical protein